METVIKVIGIVIVCIGLFYLIKPRIFRSIMGFFARGSWLYLAAILRFALAIVFIMGARHCGIKWVIVLFGLIFLLSGLLIFMMGLRKAKSIISWYLKQPMFIYRVVAVIVIAVGLIITYAA
jgi:uncharacterized protein YjeT (DUF2065 family)